MFGLIRDSDQDLILLECAHALTWQAGTNPVSFVHKAVLEYLLARNLNLDAVFDTFLVFVSGFAVLLITHLGIIFCICVRALVYL